MTRMTLFLAAGVVALADGLALVHAARNRAGEPEAMVTLTERELRYYPNKDDSGVTLMLQHTSPDAWIYTGADNPALEALMGRIGTKQLADVGFDCSRQASDKDAGEFYRRQRPRTAWGALELGGEGYADYVRYRRGTLGVDSTRKPEDIERDERQESRLVAVDVARSAETLRARYPDRTKVMIVPVVVRINAVPAVPAAFQRSARPARIAASVRPVTMAVHVPRPFSGGFLPLPARYNVTLAYGKLGEPWVTGVEIPRPSAP
jgi:hypothetical protein